MSGRGSKISKDQEQPSRGRGRGRGRFEDDDQGHDFLSSLGRGRARNYIRENELREEMPQIDRRGVRGVGNLALRAQPFQNLVSGVGGARSRRNIDELSEDFRLLSVSRPTMQATSTNTRPQDRNKDLLRTVRRTNLGMAPEPPINYEESVRMYAREIPNLMEERNFGTFGKEMLHFVEDGDQLTRAMDQFDFLDKDVVGLDFEMHNQESYEGYICLASLSSRNHTLLIDCLQDTRHKENQAKSILSELAAHPNIVKVVCGGTNDLTRLKKDFGCYPINVVDIQDMYREWVVEDEEACFKQSLPALRKQASKNKNRKNSSDDQLFAFMKFDLLLPGLEFLMNVCKIQDIKDSSMTMQDWRKRPINNNMQMYAAKDSYYTLSIFYFLLGKVGTDAVRRAAEKTSSKPVGRAPNYKVTGANLYGDRIDTAILEWRDKLAKTCDWKPEQILNNNGIKALSDWVRGHKFDPKNYDLLLKKLLDLNFRKEYSPSVRLLAAYLDPDSSNLNEMRKKICHNCNKSGHVAFFCPYDPSADAVRAFREREGQVEKQLSRNEKKLEKYAAKRNTTADQLRERMVAKWGAEKKGQAQLRQQERTPAAAAPPPPDVVPGPAPSGPSVRGPRRPPPTRVTLRPGYGPPRDSDSESDEDYVF